MERLEAALDKARTDRKTVQQAAVVVADNSPDFIPAEDPWSLLKEVSISPRVARKHRIAALKQSKDSGPYDMLRSRALRIMRENKWTTLAITSPNKSCGKTTICANLAFSLARQSDLRIVVLDLDLRRPALQRLLGQRPKHSLHEVFAGKQPVESAFIRLAPNLAFGLNLTAADNPSELLQSNTTKAKLDEIEAAFQPDLMLFDMPPMLAGDENVGFLPIVDCGLLVSSADNTTIAQLDICEKELSELTDVLGVVLNKCRYNDKDSGYDYEYY